MSRRNSPTNQLMTCPSNQAKSPTRKSREGESDQLIFYHDPVKSSDQSRASETGRPLRRRKSPTNHFMRRRKSPYNGIIRRRKSPTNQIMRRRKSPTNAREDGKGRPINIITTRPKSPTNQLLRRRKSPTDQTMRKMKEPGQSNHAMAKRRRTSRDNPHTKKRRKLRP